jgi:hypothetical protein
MPSSDWILANLTKSANEAQAMALLWHVIAVAAGVALLHAWRPSPRLAGIILAAPLSSVSILAFVFGNRFNGVVFAVLAGVLFAVALHSCSDSHAFFPRPLWMKIAGSALIAFGWFYPHFFRESSLFHYAVAAPLGVIPCPTLSFLIGATLLAGGLSRPWSAVLGLGGLFYGVFGFVRLGVQIDIVLVLGASLLLALAARSRREGAGDQTAISTDHVLAGPCTKRSQFAQSSGPR